MSSKVLLLGILTAFSCAFATVQCAAQVGWRLDTTFRQPYSPLAIGSIWEKPDGSLLLSGGIHFPEDDELDPFYHRSLVHVFDDGQIDSGFPDFPYTSGGTRLGNYQTGLYVGTLGVRKLTSEGLYDPGFIPAYNSPYVTLGGGPCDYHVFEDGRVLMVGSVELEDFARGFVGPYYSLTWFSNTGYLDTTRVHRVSNGGLFRLVPLDDGRFLCSGSASYFDGHAVGRVFRVLPDGSHDPTLTTTIDAGAPHNLYPLPDGRFYGAGRFKLAGDPNYRYVARFMPNGELDPTFPHQTAFTWPARPEGASVSGLHFLDDGRFIVFGGYTHVNGLSRKSLCVMDSLGNVIDGYFDSPNCGDYVYQGLTNGFIQGITEAANGDLYVYGGYRGYNDGVTNDPGQNLISRLKRVDTGMAVPQAAPAQPLLHVYPNPASTSVTCTIDPTIGVGEMSLVLVDLAGKTVRSVALNGTPATVLQVDDLAIGLYTVALRMNGSTLAHTALAVH